MRLTLSLMLIASGNAAFAHPGHIIDVAGHDHWVAGAAIGLAGLAALWGVIKGKKEREEEPDEEIEEELEGEPA